MNKTYLAIFLVLVLTACTVNVNNKTYTTTADPKGGLAFTLINNCSTGRVYLHIDGDTWVRQSIAAGETYSEILPTGAFMIKYWSSNSDLDVFEDFYAHDGEWAYYARTTCGGTDVPIRYYLGNNCAGVDPSIDGHANTVWHWSFQMITPGTPGSDLADPVELVIPVGESASGELPGGIYAVRDWTENGSVNHDTYVDTSSKIGFVNVNLCMNSDPLPDAPAK